MRLITSSRLFQIALLVLGLGVSACGGGGGGGSPVNPPPGGGGPPPPTQTPGPGVTSTPSPAPTGHTPAPTPSPIQTTPPPTPPPQGLTILPDTTGRFGLNQIFDQYGRGGASMTPGQVVSEAPLYDSIWGAFQPGTWYQNHPSMIISRYVLPNEDVKLISGHDFNWWNTNHPDWILYACLADGTPTHDLVGTYTNFGDIPLDIHNPAVVDYQIRQLVGPDMINEHYNTIAADNITFVNYLYDQSQPVSSGAYGCGIWQGNTFVRRYGPPTGGDFDKPDPAFISDLINWLAQARQILNTDTTLAPHHFKIVVNHPFVGGSGPNADESNMFQYVDGFLDEGGFTHYGGRVTANGFAQTLGWSQYAQSHHLAIFFADYFCSSGNTNPDTGQPCSTNPMTLTGAEIDWALATYALINNGGANVFISPEGGAIYTYRSEYSDRYGAPCPGNATYASSGNYLYTRRFAGGFAVVNAAAAGTSPQTVQLPAGHQYTDIGSRPVSNPLTVNGPDAYMLLTGGNGCT